MDQTVTEMPPRGWYLAHEVGYLVGESGNRIGAWCRRGYISASRSDGRPKVYAYQDVAEAAVVRAALQLGVTGPQLRRTITVLGKGGSRWPLANAELFVSEGGPTRTLVFRSGDVIEEVHPAGHVQQVMPVSLRNVYSYLERGGWAAELLPDLQHVEVNPDRLSGRPTIRGRRISVEQVARMAASMEWAEIREDYDLDDDEIQDAVRWWEKVQSLEAA